MFSPPKTDATRKMVLVADDDAEITQFLSMRLSELGFWVMRSPDALHALVGAHKLRPDLIILDVEMPGGNGLAAAEMLASNPELGKIPVIIFTGRTDELTLARCKNLGCSHVKKAPRAWQEIKAIICGIFPTTIPAPPADAEPSCPVVDRSRPARDEVDQASPSAAELRRSTESDPSQRGEMAHCRQDTAVASRSWDEIKASTYASLNDELEPDN